MRHVFFSAHLNHAKHVRNRTRFAELPARGMNDAVKGENVKWEKGNGMVEKYRLVVGETQQTGILLG